MSLTHDYKRAENKFAQKFKSLFSRFGKLIKSGYIKFTALLSRKYTIMIIPHTENKTKNVKITFATLLFVCLSFLIFLSSTIVLGILYTTDRQNINLSEQKLTKIENENELIKDSVTELRKSAKNYEFAFTTTLDTMGLAANSLKKNQNLTGDNLSSTSIREQNIGDVKEVQDIKSISTFLDSNVVDLGRFSELIDSRGNLLEEIPTLWPLEKKLGYITLLFGPNLHPMGGYWYLHKGIDIAYSRGTGIVSTATGKVVEVAWNDDYGNYVTIKHMYGFYTRYAHCDNIYVNEGDAVVQGQRIAALGNTGQSTGPHCHYEIRIGSQHIDPLRFLTMNR